MKTLMDSRTREELLARLQKLAPDTARVWGKMDVHQMICHLSDSFKMALGERPAACVDTVFTRTLLKWVALQTPLPWPQSVKTIQEVDAMMGGTRPVQFARDRQELEAVMKRFYESPRDFTWHPHPIFGRLSRTEWQRWGYLHMDHHFRQFGV